jgi:hypothetical protein
MIAIFYKGQAHRVQGKFLGQGHRMRPRNNFVPHALQDMDGSVDVNVAAEEKMVAPFLDQPSGDGITLWRMSRRGETISRFA